MVRRNNNVPAVMEMAAGRKIMVTIAKDINNYTNSYVFRNIVSDICINI